jgi:hypothetical protein
MGATATPRTVPSGSRCATLSFSTRFPDLPAIASTSKMSARAAGSSKRTSTTGPRTDTMRPTRCAKSSPGACPLIDSVTMFSTLSFRIILASCRRLLTVVTGISRNAATSRWLAPRR